MSTTDGEQDPGGEREPTAPQTTMPQRTLVVPRPPLVLPRAPRRRGGAWRVALALAGAVAIGFGVYAIASHHTRRSTASVGPTKAVFIARADAVCARLDPVLDGQIQTLVADYRDGDLLGARAAGAQLESSSGELVARIAALGVPSAGEGTVRLILNEYGELVGSLLTGTGEGLAAAESIGGQIAVQATEFGFHVCGQI